MERGILNLQNANAALPTPQTLTVGNAVTETNQLLAGYTGVTTTVDALNGTSLGRIFGGFTLTVGGAGGSGDFAGAIGQNFLGVTTATNIVKAGAGIQTISGVMAGTGAVTVNAGTLVLNGSNTYTGATNISSGVLKLGAAGSINNASKINVASGATFDVADVAGGYALGATQTLTGIGTVTGNMNILGTLSPGNSTGTMATGSLAWANGGDYNWEVLNVDGAAGTGYDTLSITGSLDLSNLTVGGFDINLWSLSSSGPDANGNAQNFNDTSNYQWRLASTTGGVSGFNAANFKVNTGAINGTGGFSNPSTGTFSVSAGGGNLFLNYVAVAVPEPTTLVPIVACMALVAFRRRRRSPN